MNLCASLRNGSVTFIYDPHCIAIYTALPYIPPVHAVAETSVFSRRADALLTTQERAEMISMLASDPLAGDLIPGLGGIRKLRFAPKGRGKSGAYRVIYYVLTDELPILALLIYGKNEQVDLSPDQRKAVLRLAEVMKAGIRRTA